MFDNYWFLLLLILILPIFIFRRQRFYVKHAYVQSLLLTKKKFVNRNIIRFFEPIALILLILAAANYIYSYKDHVRVVPMRKYVLVNDASGSMLGGPANERGVGPSLEIVHKGNKAFLELLKKRDDGIKDLVGATVFSDDSFVVCYLVDDPDFVENALSNVFYNKDPLGGGTSISRALWGGVELLLNDSSDILKMKERMYGNGNNYEQDEFTKEFIKRNSKTEKSSIIIFTDGVFSFVGGSGNEMSGLKLLELCRHLGIRVYFISVGSIDFQIANKVVETGGFFEVFDRFDEFSFIRVYEKILQSQASDGVIVDKAVPVKLGEYLAFVAMWLLILSLVFKWIINKNFTQV